MIADPSPSAEPFAWYRYVPHGRRAAYEAAGWTFDADLGPVHGFWTVLMRWTGAGDPPAMEIAGAEAIAA